jgi:hypothetical protein
MDKARVKKNLDQLRAAKNAIELSLEDLQTEKAFRDNVAVLYREKLLAMLQVIICEAESLKKE